MMSQFRRVAFKSWVKPVSFSPSPSLLAFSLASGILISKEAFLLQLHAHGTYPKTVNKLHTSPFSRYSPEERLRRLPFVNAMSRIFKLLWLFGRSLITAPFVFTLTNRDSSWRGWWWRTFIDSLRNGGPCIVKFTQWIATRPDIFPTEVCEECSRLQYRAKRHHWSHTRKLLKRAFGEDWRDMFELLPAEEHTVEHETPPMTSPYSPFINYEDDADERGRKDELNSMASDSDRAIMIPEGCGCVAQVYKARLKETGEMVALKIVHPDIVEEITTDLALMKWVAGMTEVIPAFTYISLREVVEEFDQLMIKQMDMTVEASALQIFNENFAKHDNIIFPRPLMHLTSTEVLVETWEDGESLQQLIWDSMENQMSNRERRNGEKVAKLGLDAFLKMLFEDNFVHGDLHPGNILVRDMDKTNPKLVILDAGITTSLSPVDRFNFIDLFQNIVRQNGRACGELMLTRSRYNQCEDPEAFYADISRVVERTGVIGTSLREMHLSELLQDVMAACYRHKVKMETKSSSVMIAIGIMEGIGRILYPEMNILKAVAPSVLKVKLSELF